MRTETLSTWYVLWHDNSGVFERCGMTERDGIRTFLTGLRQGALDATGEVIYLVWNMEISLGKFPWRRRSRNFVVGCRIRVIFAVRPWCCYCCCCLHIKPFFSTVPDINSTPVSFRILHPRHTNYVVSETDKNQSMLIRVSVTLCCLYSYIV